MTRPTKRGYIFILATTGMGGVALVNVNITTGLVAAALAAILCASLFMSFFSLYGIDLKREPSKDGQAGSMVFLPLKIINMSKGRRQAFIVREDIPFTEKVVVNTPVPPLKPGGNLIIQRRILASKRGYFKLGKITIIGGDPAGLFARRKRFVLPEDIMIFPESVKLSYMPIRIKKQIIASVTGRPIGISGIGQEFFGVREYRPSDGVRFIHWKSSARHRKLMVKDFEANAPTSVSVFLDTRGKFIGEDRFDNNFEYLIKTASSMVNYLAGMYCRLFFATSYMDREIWFTQGEAFGIKDRIMNTLAMIEPSDVPFEKLLNSEMNYLRPNSILYCLTLSESPGIKKCFDLLIERGIDVRWICAPSEYFPKFDYIPVKEEKQEKKDFTAHYGTAPHFARKGLNISRILTYG